MSVEGILERLSALPGARPIPAVSPLNAIALIAGIEVASTATTSESSLRKAWRDRRGGGATPLLLLVDDPAHEGSVLALGVVDANGPIRSIESAALAEVMERVSSKERLEAIRELAAELERLDQAGIPGLKLRDLLTLHTLDFRMRNDALRWQEASDSIKGIDRGSDWRNVLTSLGYELERRKHRGHLARYDGRPVLVVHPKADPNEFARLDQEARPPEGVLINDCLSEGAAFGLLTSGSRLRLFAADPAIGAAVAQYLDLDASALQEDDRPFLGLLGPAFLAEGGFERLRGEARQFGSGLRKRLDETIRQSVLPTLGRALGRWAKAADRDLSDEVVREDLEQAALTFVFRSLFLLYAESSGHLPMDNRSYRQSSLNSLVEEAAETLNSLSPRSTSLWDRFRLLVKAMRDGNPAWGVPAYNGALFASDGFVGAETLEKVELADPDFGLILIGLGRDTESHAGVDYSTLEIGHLGHIYEGLLSLKLSVAAKALHYDTRNDVYIPVDAEETHEIEPGDLLWQTHEGGRKSGGVYYTRSELVRHLVRQAVVPAFADHLDDVRTIADAEPAVAARRLFDFAVLDPACGSAHFLVSVVNELADMVVRFLGEVPLPEIGTLLERLRTGASPGTVIDDVSLIRRLVLKRCVFGVDVSPMGAEVAKISLWLASFVPGLSLAYLDRNVVIGNSLIGVARAESLRPPGSEDQAWFLENALYQRVQAAAQAVLHVAESDDRTPDEIEASKDADAQARAATESLERLFNLWTAEPLGLEGARLEVELHGPAVIEGRVNTLTTKAGEIAHQHRFLHWPLAFPAAFSRERPGFDAVVGNPPWEEVTVERLAFFARFQPGLKAMPESNRETAIDDLLSERPELAERLVTEQQRVAVEKAYLYSGEYPAMPGDPDLYKYFCRRYQALIRHRGRFGVVLPRTALVAQGSAGFRHWLFEETKCHRVDFLLNTGRWAFDSEPRYTIALVAAERSVPEPHHIVSVAGTASSLDEWQNQTTSPGLALSPEAFGPDWAPALLRNQSEADTFAKVRHGNRFPFGAGGRWKCFPLREFHETDDRSLWQGISEGLPLWKGESFDQYAPEGAEGRWCPDTPEIRKKAITKPRAGAESLIAPTVSSSVRREAVKKEFGRTRLAFRDATNRTNSRTVLACLIPPEVVLVNSAPYLAFVEGGNRERAACLAIMNSLPFDWQARRLVESHVSYFILEGLIVPNLSDEDFDALVHAAGRLSCIDERFAEFADSVAVDWGPLDEDEQLHLLVDIDARVARAWALSESELQLIYSDFTLDAVPSTYREALASRLRELV